MTNFELIQSMTVEQLARFLVYKILLPWAEEVGISNIQDEAISYHITILYGWLLRPAEKEKSKKDNLIHELVLLRNRMHDVKSKNLIADAIKYIDKERDK